jgi:hypothetical protein
MRQHIGYIYIYMMSQSAVTMTAVGVKSNVGDTKYTNIKQSGYELSGLDIFSYTRSIDNYDVRG